MIKIDGSYGEGGGQVVRTALALSTLLHKPFTISKIRHGRPKPGLKHQHLHCIKALKQFSGAEVTEVTGDEIGSENLDYTPGKKFFSKIKVDVGTAGSITLLLQSLLVPCLFSSKKTSIEIIGGTDVKWSPQIDYFKEIIMPQLFPYTKKLELKVEKRGYYPKGNGKIELKIVPRYNLETIKDAPKIDLMEQGKLIQIKGISHASKDLYNAEVAERQSKSAKNFLRGLNVPINIDIQYTETSSMGSGITLWGVFSMEKEDMGYLAPIKLGSDELGEKGKKAEIVGELAAKKLLEEIDSGAAVDQHLADNLILLLAFIDGKFKTSKITGHTLTNIYTVEQFIGKRFEIEGNTVRTI